MEAKHNAPEDLGKYDVDYIVTRQSSKVPQQHFDFEFLNEIADPIATDGTNTMFVTRSRPLTSHFAVAVFPRLPSTSKPYARPDDA